MTPTLEITNIIKESRNDLCLDFSIIIVKNLNGYGHIGKLLENASPLLKYTDMIQQKDKK